MCYNVIKQLRKRTVMRMKRTTRRAVFYASLCCIALSCVLFWQGARQTVPTVAQPDPPPVSLPSSAVSPLPSSAPVLPVSSAAQTVPRETLLEDARAALTALEKTGAAAEAAASAQRLVPLLRDSGEIVVADALARVLAYQNGLQTGKKGKVAFGAAAERLGVPVEQFQAAGAACYLRGQKKAGQVTLTFTGDCTFSPINEQSHYNSFDQVYARQPSASYPFDRMQPWFLTDDITCINFEGTLTDSTAHQEKQYYFRGSPSFARILPASSVELAGLANNHTYDYGKRGFEDTKRYLHAAGVSTFAVGQPYITRVNGIEVVLLGQRTNAGATDMINQIKRYKRPDNLVIPVMHWGVEFSNRVTPDTMAAGRKMIDAGADLVIGHHAHVVQGIEVYKGKYLVYNLGNFAFGANVGPVTARRTFAFRASFGLRGGSLVMTDCSIIPCDPTSDPSGWNNYQPKPLFGQEAKAVADFLVELSQSMPYGAAELSYFDC